MSKVSWTLDELFELFPDQRARSDSVRRCVEPLTGAGRFVRQTAAELISANVIVHVVPAADFSVLVAVDAPDAAPATNQELIRRSVLRGILDGTMRSAPPAWGCRIECLEVNANPLSANNISIAASMAVQDSLSKAGWDPPDPTSDSAWSAKIA